MSSSRHRTSTSSTCAATLASPSPAEDGAYVRRDQERQVRLADGESLLRRWADGAGNAFRGAARFTSSVPDPDELTARLSAGLEELGIRYALSRLAAARFIEPYAAARVVDVYVEDMPENLGSALDLLPVERGESARLVRPPDEGVFQFCQKRDGTIVVNPAQLFVDLQNGGGRESDVAERLFETTLQRLIGQDGEP